MQKTYDPALIENTCYQNWEEKGYFKPSYSGDPFCIMIPPPNVTGSLHMGHAFQQTLMDILIRYHRMMGDNTLWQAGMDHAGIATQLVVEAKLQKEGRSKHDLGREAFVEEIWKWKAQSGGRIVEQLRRMGSSLDWSSERFTLDDTISTAVRHVFESLYDEGLIYRGKRLVNWDPELLTAVSDLEVEFKERQGHLWHIRYPMAEGDESVIVATTRPETLLGDAAVAVHPEDKRYQHFIGKMLKLPLTGRLIPVIADEYVDPAFGSGCVKITPAHDFNDYEMGKRHDLPMMNIMTPDAKLNLQVPEAYQHLERFKARDQILSDLVDLGLLVKTEPHVSQVPYSGRSGAIVEPYLTEQWFIKMKPLAEPAIEVVKSGELKFVPQNWENTYFQWLENIQDWCISRQLWWGHRIPAWYDESGQIFVGDNEEKVRQKYGISKEVPLRQDEDVLDTWFSSALWPFATLGWPADTDAFKAFYPTQVLVTGFDIIFFWVARMVMMGLKFTGKSPFHTVYIHGLIRDEFGKKMSKSQGNVIDPIDLVDGIGLQDLVKKRTEGLLQPSKADAIKQNTEATFPNGISPHGTDALRFTYCALASTSRDIQFSLKRIEGYRNFCNKIWNAARYVTLQIEQRGEALLQEKTVEYSLPDRWMQDQLQQAIEKVHEALKEYRFDQLSQILYELVWNEYCDWYLELSKVILNNPDSSTAQMAGTCQTLVNVLDQCLRLLHPIIPFITENIWQTLAAFQKKTDQTIMLEPYPLSDKNQHDLLARSQIQGLKAMLLAIRNLRGEMNISPSQQLELWLYPNTKEHHHLVQPIETLLMKMGKIKSIVWLENTEQLPFSAASVCGSLELYIPLENLIDKAAEIQRLEKEIQRIKLELGRAQVKLDNPEYVKKAPEAVVLKEKEKVRTLQMNLDTLQQQLEKMHASSTTRKSE